MTYWAIPDATNPTIIQLSDTMGGTPITFTESGKQTLTFDPSVAISGNNNTVNLGFNFALAKGGNPGYLANGTPLVYEAALDFSVQGLINGTTYYVIQDPADPQVMRLTQLNTDPLNGNNTYAQEAYNAGATALTANVATAATPFQVNVNASTNPTNSIDFGSQGTFDTNDVLIYEGPTGSNPAIGGLNPGETYYALVPDPTNPGVIELTMPREPSRKSACPPGPQLRPSTSSRPRWRPA